MKTEELIKSQLWAIFSKSAGVVPSMNSCAKLPKLPFYKEWCIGYGGNNYITIGVKDRIFRNYNSLMTAQFVKIDGEDGGEVYVALPSYSVDSWITGLQANLKTFLRAHALEFGIFTTSRSGCIYGSFFLKFTGLSEYYVK
jgi:hypothetical protein